MIKSNDQEESLAVEMKEEDICKTKCEMSEVEGENKKLKLLISNVVKDYKSLQTHFFHVLQRDESKNLKIKELSNTLKEIKEDPLLVSLSLGRTNSIDSSSESIKEGKRGVSLGLDSFEEPKKQETISETWPTSKVLKNIRCNPDEQTLFKKARVSIRTRCDSHTMNDGCQWRKYGQKVAKGNPSPRAYYRCSISPTCPVRKQVQRCNEDMSILVSTYEGTHNHPLPPSATAVASTTSAAAAMLGFHSSHSKFESSVSAPLSNSTATNSALNFSSSYLNHDQLYISNSNPSISTMNSHPTITLDLTNYNPSQYSTPKFPSSTRSFSPSCTNLDFSSNSSSQHYNFNTTSWNSLLTGNSLPKQDVYNKESIAAATKMIASNPNFQSALAAAISSYVGCRGGNVKENHGIGMDHSNLNLNLGNEAAHS